MILRALERLGLRPRLGQLRQHAPLEWDARRLAPVAPCANPPRISIVTPSRNQAKFVAQAIASVLDQGHAALEYVVIDGASDDGSARAIATFAPRLAHWESEPDDGQAQAIDKGFRRTSGEIMGWVNSDDVLLPGALHAVARAFAELPEVDVVYGDRILIDEQGRAIGRWALPSHGRLAYAYGDFIPQETMFWRRALWERVGASLDESFRFAMDWDLIARFDAAGARFLHLPRFLAAFRVHAQQKTSSQMDSIGAEESERILRRMHRRRVLPLERTLRLVPYMLRHVLQDRRVAATYRQLVDPSEPPVMSPPATESPAMPPFGMRTALQGLRDRGYRPGVVYDIGAADGGWTRLALQFWPQARYVCFEPLAERRGALEALAAERREQVSIQACGVGDADGELSLGVTEFLWDSSFAYAGSSARKVPVRRLDSLHAREGVPRPDFVKIDVQGFEKRVMDGGAEVLARADFVLMECNFIAFCDEMRTLDQSIRDMSERGFVPYEFVDFLRRPLDGAMGQCDILFARRDHPLVGDRRWGP